MPSTMDEKTFLDFYKNTILGYSKNLQKYICTLLEQEGRITFEEQRNLFDSNEKVYFESKKDFKKIIIETATDIKFSNFYEKWEFIKLYKYSVPFFYKMPEGKDFQKLIEEKKITLFKDKEFKASYVISSSFKDATPLCMIKEEKIFLKFVLQKSFLTPNSYDRIDYRYPLVIYFDLKNSCLEVRYDSTKYSASFNNEVYEDIVNDCIEWLTRELGLILFDCDHNNIIDVVNDKQNESVKMYKQMMELSSGGAAELTASESADYVLPFIGEIRELIDENEELFSEAEDVKQLLLQYLEDKEATARYPYIYIKWVDPVESQSYIVKVTFDYFNHKHTLLQHITGSCKDLGMERMNNAIEYLCQSGSFVRGEAI